MNEYQVNKSKTKAPTGFGDIGNANDIERNWCFPFNPRSSGCESHDIPEIALDYPQNEAICELLARKC